MKVFILALFFTSSLLAKTQLVYFNKMFGHIHENSSRYSKALTSVSCGHPLKLLSDREKWVKVKAGPYNGFVSKNLVSFRKSELRCFQDKYPKFFNSLKLDVSEIYYWAKLYDNFVSGKTELK